MVTAENRQGRPGLSHAPRGENGQVIAATGSVGDERATTLVPRWLETERHCRAVLELDSTGQVCAINVLGDHLSPETSGDGEAVWAGMRVREGEVLRVVSEDGTWATRAWYRNGAIVLDRAPLVGQVCAVLITRVREVPCCGLDLIERKGRMGNVEIGEAIGRHRTLAAKEIKQALRKAVAEGERQGIEARDLLRALMEMGGK